MAHQPDHQDSQMMMEQKGDMMMQMQGCHTTMHVFGFLVLLGILVQIVLQSKMLKELRRTSRK